MKNDPKHSGKVLTLYRWIWESYRKAVILPMILIVFGFSMFYFFTLQWNRSETIDYLFEEANRELKLMSEDKASMIKNQLDGVAYEADLFRYMTAEALLEEVNDLSVLERLQYSTEGAYYTTEDTQTGGAAVFYSGYFPIREEEQLKVAKILRLEKNMELMSETNPLITSLYFNTFDSLNVIYPYFDVLEQYPAKMNIPEYNFYYEADETNNPERNVVWTDAYLDPAGHGWMASVIAPVYREDFLEGVIGIDVTIRTITQDLLNLPIPWEGYAMLIGKDGTILALTEEGEKDWQLDELKEVNYSEAVYEDTYKPEEFNLFSKETMSGLATSIKQEDQGSRSIDLYGESRVVAWSSLGEIGWKLLMVVPEDNIYANVKEMNNRILYVGILVGILFVALFAGFIVFIARRASTMSRKIALPLEEMDKIAKRIGEGEYLQKVPDIQVYELKETATNLVDMGETLGRTNQELLELEKTALLAKDEAEKANEAKSEFLSSMSHELRTPLNAVLGYAQVLLMEEDKLDESQRNCITEIYQAGKHLLALINQVLDLSRIEAGYMNVNMEIFDIREAVHEVLSLMEPLSKQNDVRIETVNAQDDLTPSLVFADRMRTKQVLINLVSNGIKYNRSNGRVKIACREIEERLIIEVEDNGVGITKEDQKVVFKPFHRLDHGKQTIEGTGIGLAVTKQLVELMGGTIRLESEFGVGSRFIVEFMAYKEGADSLKLHVLSKNHDFELLKNQPYRILYIEDNPTNMNMIENALMLLGIGLIKAASAESAFEILEDQEVDLILLDINLSGMNGYEFYQKLIQDPVRSRIPVIAISAGAMENDIHRGLEVGFHRYLTKPIDLEELFSAMYELLKQKNV